MMQRGIWPLQALRWVHCIIFCQDNRRKIQQQQELIRAGAEIDLPNINGYTPLACAIYESYYNCAEYLVDGGAKMSNVRKDIKIPNWMNDIINKRKNVKRSLLIFNGVLRKRFVVRGEGTQHLGGRIPRDIVNVLSGLLWGTRFNPLWISTVDM